MNDTGARSANRAPVSAFHWSASHDPIMEMDDAHLFTKEVDLTEFWASAQNEPIKSLYELIDGTLSGVGAIALQPQGAEEQL